MKYQKTTMTIVVVTDPAVHDANYVEDELEMMLENGLQRGGMDLLVEEYHTSIETKDED